jgi:hypothetical protein
VRLVTDAHGEQRIAVTDRSPRSGAADFVRLYPQPDGLGKGAYRALHPQTAMGAMFNRIRLAHMDREGIDVQVIYGSLTLTFASLIDRDLAVALCRAYNDYIRDDCEPYRTRMVPIGVLPLQDVAEAVREMQRAPRHLSDPSFFPLYEAAESLGVATGLHGTPGAYLCGGNADQLDTFALVHLFGHRNQQQMAMAKLVMDGVFERFPLLRVGFLEAGCGWLPDLVHALHEHWEKRVRDFDPRYRPSAMTFALETVRDRNRLRVGRWSKAGNLLRMARTRSPLRGTTGDDTDYLYEHRALTRDPVEYFARGQVFTTFEPDDPAPVYLRTALGDMGEGLAGWSVDYGHWDGVLTDCVKRVAENPQIDPAYAVQLLSANALRFYGPRLKERIVSHRNGGSPP